MKHIANKLATVAFPKIMFEAFLSYFRVEVEGIEHLPRRGRALIVPNHSGCSGLDAALLGYVLNKEFGRIPRILALWTFFQWFPPFEDIAKKMGLMAASLKNGIDLLRKNHLTILFPEGVKGSFKPTCERYHLQSFHTGFVRMAILTSSPVIPCIIIGAEESNINLANLHFQKDLTIPIPFNLLPLPAKWKIQFLPSVDLSHYSAEDANHKETMRLAADDLRRKMQKAIDEELEKRKYIYFPNSASNSVPSPYITYKSFR